VRKEPLCKSRRWFHSTLAERAVKNIDNSISGLGVTTVITKPYSLLDPILAHSIEGWGSGIGSRIGN
jgi:hypothetical protein